MKKVITLVTLVAMVIGLMVPAFAASYNPHGSTPYEDATEGPAYYTVKKTDASNLKKDGVIGENEYEKLDVDVDPDNTYLHLIYNQSSDYDFGENLLGNVEYYASWSDGQINIAVKAKADHMTQIMDIETPECPKDNFCHNLSLTISSDQIQTREKGKVCNFYYAIAKRTDTGNYLVGYYTNEDPNYNQLGNSGNYVPEADKDFAIAYTDDGYAIYEWSIPFAETCKNGTASAGDNVYLTIAVTSGAGDTVDEWGDLHESWYGVAMGDFGFGVAQKEAVNHQAFKLSSESLDKWDNPFTDLKEGAFYTDAVEWAVKGGITNGLTDTTFGPDSSCTRGHVVTFLWRAAGSPEPTSTTCNFTDVDPKGFYYKAMLWAVENGITKGMTDTTFGPKVACTRGQVVAFLHRAKGSPAPTTTSTAFTDVSAKKYYYSAMLWAVGNGITKGTSQTSFSPNAACTRAEVVTFLYRSAQLPPAEEPPEEPGEDPSEPGEDPTEPGEPGEPGEDPTEPTEPGEHPTEPGEPGEDPTEPGEDPTEPGEPGEPGEDPTEPTTPADPIEDPTEPGEGPADPINEP